jgi:hypothetical protein
MDINLDLLRPVELSDRPRFVEMLKIMQTQSCECAFANIFMYRDAYGMEFLDLGSCLVVFERKERAIHYPIGHWTSPEDLKQISDTFMKAGLTDGGIYDVPEEFLDRYPDCAPLFEIEYDEGAIDYLYSIEKLANCTGQKLRKKNNLIKQFQAEWPHAEVRKLTKDDVNVVRSLAKALNNQVVRCQFLIEEEEAMEYAWNHFDEMELGGIILYAENNYPAGFSVFSYISDDTVDINFEKADHSVKGAAQTLTRLVALELRGKARFMNREQDMNEAGLRHAKRSLDPERFFKRYFLRTSL